MTAHTHTEFVPGCYRCDLGRDEVETARMDDRVEDVARTIHYLGALEPEVYFAADYPHAWENENWGHVKSVRAQARDLIDAFDARAAGLVPETPKANG